MMNSVLSPGRGLARAFIALSLPLLSACQLFDLRDDLAEIERLATISGQIETIADLDAPVLLAIAKDEFRRDAVIEVRVIDPEGFDLRLPSGTYYAFALQDENRDFRYQAEEPAGFFGEPTKIELAPGAVRNDIVISLKRDLGLPDDRDQATGAPPNLWAGRRNVGALTALNDPRFDPEIAKTGLWQPLKFSLDPGPGLFFLEPYTARKMPVLFVHGILGTPRDFAPIIAGIDREKLQPWVFTYASGLPLAANARYLREAIQQLQLLHGFTQMSVVAHSMGGLISQAFLDLHETGEAGYIDNLITISTPWQGHDAARLGTELSPVVAPVWVDMAPESPFLRNLGIVRDASSPEYTLLFGFHGGGLLSQTANDGTVTVLSQLDQRAQERASLIRGFDAGHVDILGREDVGAIVQDILDKAAAQ